MNPVDKGIELLDRLVPQWPEKIDPSKLDMGLCLTCILGQLYGEFWLGISVVFGTTEFDHTNILRVAEQYGFYMLDELKYEQLTQAWREAISAKRIVR